MGTLGKALGEVLPLLCLSGEEQYFLSFFSFFMCLNYFIAFLSGGCFILREH